MPEMKVRDVMTPDPVALPASATIGDAAKAMRESNIGAVVISDKQGLCGILTDRDVVVRGLAEGRDPNTATAGEICSRDLNSLRPDDTLERAVKLMRQRAIRRLVVVDGSKLVGILSIGDLAVKLDRTSVLGDICAAHPNH